MGFLQFLKGAARQVAIGGKAYRAWVALLAAMIAIGLFGYSKQWQLGLIATEFDQALQKAR